MRRSVDGRLAHLNRVSTVERRAKPAERNIIDLYVGRRIKILRKQNHITQKDLAERLGITFQQIQKYEKGLNRLPASRMLSICMALNITPNDLFRDLLSKEYPIKEPIDYTTQEVELIETVRQLTPTMKSQVRQIVGTLVGE